MNIQSINDMVGETLETIRSRISANIEGNPPILKASGKTQQSMSVELRNMGGTLYGRRDFQSLELGRPPAPVPANFTEIIAQWMEDKRIMDKEEALKSGRAFLTARKIEREGTRLYREGGRNDIYTPVIEEELKKLNEKLFLELKTDILEDIRNYGRN